MNGMKASEFANDNDTDEVPCAGFAGVVALGLWQSLSQRLPRHGSVRLCLFVLLLFGKLYRAAYC